MWRFVQRIYHTADRSAEKEAKPKKQMILPLQILLLILILENCILFH